MLHVSFKSGDGESYIIAIKKKDKESDEWNLVKNNTPEYYSLSESLEDEYSHIIFKHDHEDNTGYGSFIVNNNGSVVEGKYVEE